MSPKIEDVNAATDLFNVIPTGENSNTLEQAKLNLQSHREDVKTRNEYKKFVADFHLSERATNSFFRTPQPACLRSPITELKRVDGSVMDDQVEIASGHRQFWGNYSNPPHWNFGINIQSLQTCQSTSGDDR
ncbi:hypothetical protein PI126_g5314 [Phytophthora idaei]|nr:hypothetical protein PI126_g5314 [Phytophthora idaei]